MLGFIFFWLDHFPYFDTSDSLFSLISFHRILCFPDFPSPSLMFLLDLLYDLFSLFLYVKWHFPWVLSLALSPLFFILNTCHAWLYHCLLFQGCWWFPKESLEPNYFQKSHVCVFNHLQTTFPVKHSFLQMPQIRNWIHHLLPLNYRPVLFLDFPISGNMTPWAMNLRLFIDSSLFPIP